MSGFAKRYLDEGIEVLKGIDAEAVDRLAKGLAAKRAEGGRLFILGNGGSAGHASHAVNDFRKLCGFEAYAPTDNVSELTARINDEGWDGAFAEWLKVSRLSRKDAVLIFSVGGGSKSRNISMNLVQAIDGAKKVGAAVFAICGKDGGYAKEAGDVCVLVPTVAAEHVTPHTEGFCAVIWHCLVSHPDLKVNPTKW